MSGQICLYSPVKSQVVILEIECCKCRQETHLSDLLHIRPSAFPASLLKCLDGCNGGGKVPTEKADGKSINSSDYVCWERLVKNACVFPACQRWSSCFVKCAAKDADCWRYFHQSQGQVGLCSPRAVAGGITSFLHGGRWPVSTSVHCHYPVPVPTDYRHETFAQMILSC